MKSIALYVDGNYVFHQAKAAGKPQDFAKIISNLEARLDGKVCIKRFYTRPPQDTNSGPVLSWLQAHGWQTQWLNYQFTHQDSLYVPLVADMFADFLDNDEVDTVVVLSGSGALTYPCSRLPLKPLIFTTEESGNKRLKTSENVEIHNLQEIL